MRNTNGGTEERRQQEYITTTVVGTLRIYACNQSIHKHKHKHTGSQQGLICATLPPRLQHIGSSDRLSRLMCPFCVWFLKRKYKKQKPTLGICVNQSITDVNNKIYFKKINIQTLQLQPGFHWNPHFQQLLSILLYNSCSEALFPAPSAICLWTGVDRDCECANCVQADTPPSTASQSWGHPARVSRLNILENEG